MLKELLRTGGGEKRRNTYGVFRQLDCLEEILMSTLLADIWDVISTFIDELLA